MEHLVMIGDMFVSVHELYTISNANITINDNRQKFSQEVVMFPATIVFLAGVYTLWTAINRKVNPIHGDWKAVLMVKRAFVLSALGAFMLGMMYVSGTLSKTLAAWISVSITIPTACESSFRYMCNPLVKRTSKQERLLSDLKKAKDERKDTSLDSIIRYVSDSTPDDGYGLQVLCDRLQDLDVVPKTIVSNLKHGLYNENVCRQCGKAGELWSGCTCSNRVHIECFEDYFYYKPEEYTHCKVCEQKRAGVVALTIQKTHYSGQLFWILNFLLILCVIADTPTPGFSALLTACAAYVLFLAYTDNQKAVTKRIAIHSSVFTVTTVEGKRVGSVDSTVIYAFKWCSKLARVLSSSS
jgi:hypothetical protein